MRAPARNGAGWLIDTFLVVFGYVYTQSSGPVGCDMSGCTLSGCLDADRDWNALFSNEALCRVYIDADRHKRAPGVPCLHRAAAVALPGVRELNMPPSALIWHLKSIGWYGRMEFVERLSLAYNAKLIESGG